MSFGADMVKLFPSCMGHFVIKIVVLNFKPKYLSSLLLLIYFRRDLSEEYDNDKII